MKDRTFFNWLIILLGVVAIMSFCFTPVFAEMDDQMSSNESTDNIMVEQLDPGYEILDEAFGERGQYTYIPIDNFTMWNSAATYNVYSGDYFRYFTNTGSHWLGSGINLPSGAYLKSLMVHFYDNHAGNISVYVWRFTPYGNRTLLAQDSSSGTPGYATMFLDIQHTIQNADGYYVIYVGASTGSSNLRIGSVRLAWMRQISPAPSSATFNDVGTGHWAFQSVEALAASGITKGCPDCAGCFCPDKPVSRAAMAAFLARALGLHWDFPY